MALVLAPEPPVAEWMAALDAQIQRSPSFFEGRPVLVDLGALPADQPDVAGLLESLRARGIRIVGTEGAHPSWQDVESWGRPLSGGSRTARPVEAPDESAASPPPAAPPPSPESGSLLVDHSVRSGQSVVCERGDVIVVGSVA